MNNNNAGCDKYPYREAIGSLMFLTQLTRPDIIFAVHFLSYFISNYSEIYYGKKIKGSLSFFHKKGNFQMAVTLLHIIGLRPTKKRYKS